MLRYVLQFLDGIVVTFTLLHVSKIVSCVNIVRV